MHYSICQGKVVLQGRSEHVQLSSWIPFRFPDRHLCQKWSVRLACCKMLISNFMSAGELELCGSLRTPSELITMFKFVQPQLTDPPNRMSTFVANAWSSSESSIISTRGSPSPCCRVSSEREEEWQWRLTKGVWVLREENSNTARRR